MKIFFGRPWSRGPQLGSSSVSVQGIYFPGEPGGSRSSRTRSEPMVLWQQAAAVPQRWQSF
eukprot:2276193-Pyramimonas_sp.AAC.1